MSLNTAISARGYGGTQTITFCDEEHEIFYQNYLLECRWQDVYHKALIYCLGISSDTRNHIHAIYDFKTGCVKTECLKEGWITSGSARVIRMAFNLYCNGTPSAYAEDDEFDPEEALEECSRYTPENLFCCGYARYFWEAIKIRYPEYTGSGN
ncbi:MAG: hypothetical protein KH828_11300 [Clostridiales bacterium]|nr:hypothetical protein [Clostridiales bacterium]